MCDKEPQRTSAGRLHNSGIFFLENLGNCREKIKKFENFRQFEHSPDILETFHGKNVDKMFFVVFLPTKRGLSLICYSSDCLLSTTNQRFFYQSRLHYDLSVFIHQKRLSLSPSLLEKIIKFFPLRIEDLRYVLRKILLQSILH